MDATGETLCSEDLMRFHATYREFYKYCALVFCVFGIVANILTVLLLTRRERRSPINVLLVARVIANTPYLVTFIPHLIIAYQPLHPNVHTYSRAVFTIFSTHLFYFFKLISEFLTVTIAVWVLIVNVYPHKANKMFSMRRVYIVIVSLCIGGAIIYSPMLFDRCLAAFDEWNEIVRDENKNWERANLSFGENQCEVGGVFSKAFRYAMFWVTAVALKLVSCFLVILIVLKVWWSMVKRNWQRRNVAAVEMVNISGITEENKDLAEEVTSTDSSSKIITTFIFFVTLMFLLDGILSILFAIYYYDIPDDCFNALRDGIFLLTIVDSMSVFLVSVAIDRTFRTSLIDLFRPNNFMKNCFRRSSEQDFQTLMSVET